VCRITALHRHGQVGLADAAAPPRPSAASARTSRCRQGSSANCAVWRPKGIGGRSSCCLRMQRRLDPCRAVPCRAVPCRAGPGRAVPCRAVPCRAGRPTPRIGDGCLHRFQRSMRFPRGTRSLRIVNRRTSGRRPRSGREDAHDQQPGRAALGASSPGQPSVNSCSPTVWKQASSVGRGAGRAAQSGRGVRGC
jgi:hypothetical protein